MILEEARKKALEMLGEAPSGAEVSIAGLDEPEVFLGMGYLVGRGFAVYRGGYTFRLTGDGRAAFLELSDDT